MVAQILQWEYIYYQKVRHKVRPQQSFKPIIADLCGIWTCLNSHSHANLLLFK